MDPWRSRSWARTWPTKSRTSGTVDRLRPRPPGGPVCSRTSRGPWASNFANRSERLIAAKFGIMSSHEPRGAGSPGRRRGNLLIMRNATPRALLLDFGSVISMSAFERHTETQSILQLVPGSLTWLGPFDPTTDPLWASMQREEISEREYWAFRSEQLGLAVGEPG